MCFSFVKEPRAASYKLQAGTRIEFLQLENYGLKLLC